MRSARASSTVANTGIRLSRSLSRSIFATGGRGAIRPKPHPAASAWLAIRTKALSPRASQKYRPVRSSSSSRTGRAMAAQPCATTPSLVVRSSSAGILTISIPAPRAVAVSFSPWIIVFCHLSSIAVDACGLPSHGGLPGGLGPKVLTRPGASVNGHAAGDAAAADALRRSAGHPGTGVSVPEWPVNQRPDRTGKAGHCGARRLRGSRGCRKRTAPIARPRRRR